MLIDRGILARPVFKIGTLSTRPKNLMLGTPWQAAYRLGIVNNDERNQAIAFEAHRAALNGLSVMVLIQQKAHGRILSELLAKRGLRVAFIDGDNDQAERKKALQGLASGQINVLIGSTILDVGVDVPAVGMVILAGGGKAEVALRQRIGRGLRAKKSGPNVALILDLFDGHNRYLKEHSLQRLSIINGTEGFAENILPDGKDFDYEALGLAKVRP
jgi:superfamily II DNA or RNA helicase